VFRSLSLRRGNDCRGKHGAACKAMIYSSRCVPRKFHRLFCSREMFISFRMLLVRFGGSCHMCFAFSTYVYVGVMPLCIVHEMSQVDSTCVNTAAKSPAPASATTRLIPGLRMSLTDLSGLHTCQQCSVPQMLDLRESCCDSCVVGSCTGTRVWARALATTESTSALGPRVYLGGAPQSCMHACLWFSQMRDALPIETARNQPGANATL
jgi:hypothetical protein